MSRSITPEELLGSGGPVAMLDIRKELARLSSGETIPGALRRLPSDAERWWPEFSGKRVAVFCAHGHEVSQAVCAFLNDNGVEARFLEGGFEAWKAAGLPVSPIRDGR